MRKRDAFRIEDHLEELARPGVFRVAGAVEILQTHISVVCLVGDRAFKLKKAVRLPFVDFSTRELRSVACQDELRLNRRLCPDIYLDVVPVWRDAAGGLRVGGSDAGELVDHAVEMVRLPQERMLDVLLADDAVRPAEMARLARAVARFHATEAASADDAVRAAGAPGGLIEQIRANFAETVPMVGSCFCPRLHSAVRDRVGAALPALRETLEARAAAGRIVEGHGDLHARNVCMIDPPAIYDCIEFRRDFRCEDVATEIAFLAMDLRYRGHRELADIFVDAYVEAARDDGLRAVLPELERYRAMVRAKVDAFGHAETSIPDRERERLRGGARRHLRWCAWSRVEQDGPLLLVTSGLPASGKTFVTAALCREAGWPVVATDRVRKRLAGVAATARLDASAYSATSSDRTYAVAIAEAAALGGCAILDGNFPTVSRRAAAIGAARAAHKRVAVVHMTVDEATARARLEARARDRTSISDAGVDVFEKLAQGYVPPEDSDGARVIRLAGDVPFADALDRLAVELLGVSG